MSTTKIKHSIIHSDFLLAICVSPNAKILLQVKAMLSRLWARMYVLCGKGRFSSKWDTWKLLGKESLLVAWSFVGCVVGSGWPLLQMVFVYTVEKAANTFHTSHLPVHLFQELWVAILVSFQKRGGGGRPLIVPPSEEYLLPTRQGWPVLTEQEDSSIHILGFFF